MNYNINSDIDQVFWGFREYEGLKFFIEPGVEKHPLCPFKIPNEKLVCPHSGLCAENNKIWKKTKFVVDNELGTKKLERLIPKSLVVKPNLTFISADFLPSVSKIKLLLSLTNAVPLMIYGLRTKHDYNYIFNLARSSEIRPVYVSGSSAIPIPKDFK